MKITIYFVQTLLVTVQSSGSNQNIAKRVVTCWNSLLITYLHISGPHNREYPMYRSYMSHSVFISCQCEQLYSKLRLICIILLFARCYDCLCWKLVKMCCYNKFVTLDGWCYCIQRVEGTAMVRSAKYTEHKHTPLHLCLMACVSNYFKANVCRCLSACAHVCFYLGLCLCLFQQWVCLMVCAEIHLIVALPPFKMCVYVCLDATFSLSNKLKNAAISVKDWGKRAKIVKMIGETKGREIKVRVKRKGKIK